MLLTGIGEGLLACLAGQVDSVVLMDLLCGCESTGDRLEEMLTLVTCNGCWVGGSGRRGGCLLRWEVW